MTEKKRSQRIIKIADTNLEPRHIALDEPVPMANDPGGAHTKGYTADSEPHADTNVKTERSIPLAPDREQEVD